MLAQRRRAPSDPVVRPRVRRRLHRLGLIAATVALAAQLAVALAPMPRMAGAETSTLSRLAAFWGLNSLCLPSAPAQGKADGLPGSLAGHDCPICQLMHQTAAFLAPVAAEVAVRPVSPRHPPALAAADRPTRPVPSQSQPRAPPPTA